MKSRFWPVHLAIVFTAFTAVCRNSAYAMGAPVSYPMADHVPGDAIAYFGWVGTDALRSSYQVSDLADFLNHSNLPRLAERYVPRLWDYLAGEADDKEALVAMQKSLRLLVHHPIGVYVSNVRINSDGTPDADVAMVCDAGVDADELQSDLRSVVKNFPHLHVSGSGTLIRVGVDDSVKANPGPTLNTNAAFIAATGSLQKSPAMVVYVDGKSLLKDADQSAMKNERTAETWPKVRDALGIAGFKSFAMTMGFDGSDWMTASSLQAAMPRGGLLGAFEPRAIDPVLLAHIPPSAGSVSVYNLDLGKLFDTIGAAMAANPDSDKFFHQASGVATIGLGRNFRQQILGPLGPQWVMYSDAKLHSVVVLNHPNDADTAGDSLISATFGLVNLANTQIPGASTQPVVNAEQTTVKGIDLTAAVTRWGSPTFAVNDGVLYMGLSQASVVASATAAKATASHDFLHSEDFVSSVQRLGIPGFASFDFCDLPRTAPEAYKHFGASGDQVKRIFDQLGIEMPAVELPPVEQVQPRLSPALSLCWTDGDGIYCRSISPFPLSTCLLGDPQESMMTAGSVATAVAIVLPSVQKARERATQFSNASRQRQILMALMMYANSHRGAFPPDLGTLVREGLVGAPDGFKIFLQAESRVKIPNEIKTGTRDQQADWVNENCEFAFLAPGEQLSRMQQPSTLAVLVPKDADRATGWVNVGFADGHVEARKAEYAQHQLHPDAAPETP